MAEDTFGAALGSLATWIPDALPPEGQRAALHRLVAAMRNISEALTDMDASEEDLLAAAEAAEAFAMRLETTRKGHTQWGFAEAGPSGNVRAMFDRSPVIGLGNPVAAPLRMRIEGEQVVGIANFGAQYEGPPGHVHGGITAAAFDEVLGMAQARTGRPGMTGTLTIKYRQPTPLHREVVFRGWVDRIDGRKIFAAGTLHSGETLCAQPEGVFISVDFERLRQGLQSQ
ncbi:MAG TPA: PaaI family thioesterase [Tepidiformaceae bacterium]|nr:PaaI family thioesterase [Tepidiformaceae bacterium]